MEWFSSSKEPQSKILSETAANALSVFHTTISKLKEVVKSAEDSIKTNQKSIDELTAENNKLKTIVTENAIMASKLSDLFNPPASSSSDAGNL